MANRIQFRRDTAANWESINPILMSGELGLETDTRFCKIGNGVDNWNDLPYAQVIHNITNELGNSEDLVISQKGFSETINKLKNHLNFDNDALVLKTSLKTSNRDIITFFEYLGVRYLIFGDSNGQGSQITMTSNSTFYNYNNGMFGISLVTNQQESTQNKAPIGITRYFWRNSQDKDVPFDIVNGVNGSSQYTMNNMQGNKLFEVLNNGKFNFYHSITGKRIFTTDTEGLVPGNAFFIEYPITDSTNGLCFINRSIYINYDDGNYGLTLVNSKDDVNNFVAPLGICRYYSPGDRLADDYLNVERMCDHVDGSDATKPQYQLYNTAGKTVMEIDKDGDLQIDGYVKQSQLTNILSEFAGKKIVMIGDSVMTGYPNNQGDGDTDDAKTYAYPYILGNMLGAEVKVIALPNAVARTSNIDGEVQDARKDRIFMNTIEQATSLNNGDTTKIQTATKFSYQSEFTNVLQDADLIIWGLGVNDVDEDVVGEGSNRKFRNDSEFIVNTTVPIDTTDTKYYTGAFNTFMNYVYSNKITAKVAILTHYTYSDAQFYPLNLNERLIARQKELAKHWSIPFLCPADLLGWGYNGDRTKSSLIHYCPDEIHPTKQEGKNQLSKAIKKELENKIVLV